MARESTPLLRTVQIAPVRRRYPHQTCRRFFTLAFTSILIAGFGSFLLHLFILEPYHYNYQHHRHYSVSYKDGKRFSHDHLKKVLLDTPKADAAREWSQYYTSGAHLAGKNFSQADWTREKWQSWGVDSSIATYDTYINYPVENGLSLLEKSKKSDSWKVAFKASLKEDVLEQDPTTSSKDSIPIFHGYSASGNVTAQYVYANYGTFLDFQDLINAGIDLKGKIAVVKYGNIFRGLKVKRAQELGMVGTIIYSDPGDDGDMTETNGHKPYPDGPARNPSSVQRGSVQFLSVRPGDPTTPGYPSKPDSPRAPVDDSTPSIPSIPISYADAIPILKALNGHGPNAKDLGKYWQRRLGLGHKGVKYHVGPSPEGTVLNLYNKQEYVTTPMWDVIGIVNGTIPNEVIIVGNHRDAWIVGGASDPNSGSAIMNEVVRSVGKALDKGWKPLRTIVFGSWDGEEYGLVGSTEWVEEYLPWISDANVAYLNVDVGASGPIFKASAAPLLNKILRAATHEVLSPNQTVKGQTIGDVWDGQISTMGSGSDFTAFQDYAGVPCIDIGFKEDPKGPVYHYHSNYDSFYWMNEYGDPGYVYHETMAKLLGIILAELSDTIVIPFGAKDYAEALIGYLDQVEAKLKNSNSTENRLTASMKIQDLVGLRDPTYPGGVKGSADAFQAALDKLHNSLLGFRDSAADLDAKAAWAQEKLDEGLSWWNIVGKIKLGLTIHRINKNYKELERHFLFEGGLDGRDWYKHVVFAPGLWTGYSGAVYPGLTESIDNRDYSNGLKWARIIQSCVEKATHGVK